MNLSNRTSAILLCVLLLLLIAYNNNTRNEGKCEVIKDVNKYLKCRRRLILRHCGEVCNTTPEVDESKYYRTVITGYLFVIAYLQ